MPTVNSAPSPKNAAGSHTTTSCRRGLMLRFPLLRLPLRVATASLGTSIFMLIVLPPPAYMGTLKLDSSAEALGTTESPLANASSAPPGSFGVATKSFSRL